MYEQKKELLEAIKKKSFISLTKIKQEFLEDRDIVEALIEYKKRGDFVCGLDWVVRDRELVLKILNSGFGFYPSYFSNDLEIVKKVLQLDGSFIKFYPDFINNAEMVAIALNSNPLSYELIDDTLKNKENILKVLDIFLPKIPSSLLEDKEILLKTLKYKNSIDQDTIDKINFQEKDILSLRFLSFHLIRHISHLNDNEKVMQHLVQLNPHEFKDSSERLKNDKIFCLIAIKANPFNFRYISDDFKYDKEIIQYTLSLNGNLYQYIPEVLKEDKEIKSSAILNGCSTEYFNTLTLEESFECMDQSIIAYYNLPSCLKDKKEVIDYFIEKVEESIRLLETFDIHILLEADINKDFIPNHLLNKILEVYKDKTIIGLVLQKSNFCPTDSIIDQLVALDNPYLNGLIQNQKILWESQKEEKILSQWMNGLKY